MIKSSKEKSGKLFWISFAAITVIYVAAMSVFTFYDYEITSSLYDKGTAFGVIFEISGPVFMPFFGIYSIVSLPFVLKVKKTPVKVLLYVVLILLYAYYCFMGAFTLKYSYAPFMFIPSIIIYVTFTVLCFFINVKMPDSKRAIHKCVILVTFFTVLTAMLGVDLIKVVFGRKRFCAFLEGPFQAVDFRREGFDAFCQFLDFGFVGVVLLGGAAEVFFKAARAEFCEAEARRAGNAVPNQHGKRNKPAKHKGSQQQVIAGHGSFGGQGIHEAWIQRQLKWCREGCLVVHKEQHYQEKDQHKDKDLQIAHNVLLKLFQRASPFFRRRTPLE